MTEEKYSDKTKSYEFGDYHLSGALKELKCGSESVDIQRRVLDLLTYLIENRDRTVSKEEIQDAVWPGTIVTEAALTRAVMKARRAVDDDAARQAIIKTVHGQGYRFVADVVEVAEQALADGEYQHDRRQALLRVATTYGAAAWLINQAAAMVWEAFEWSRWPQQLLLGISLLGFPLALTLTWFYRITTTGVALRSERNRITVSRSERGWERPVIAMLSVALLLSIGWNLRDDIQAADPLERVAVLPLRNETGDAQFAWLSLGMLGLLNTHLADADIPVVAATAILRAVPEPVAAADAALLERMRATEGVRYVFDLGIAAAGQEFRTQGAYFDRGQRVSLPSFTGASPSEAVRALGRHLVSVLKPDESLPDTAYASGDLFVDQAFARGMNELLSGNQERARDLLEVAVNARPDAFWPNYELAVALRGLGELEQAQQRDLALLEDARSREDALQIALLSNELGIINDLTGDLDQSERHYVEGLRWTEQAGLYQRQAVLLINYAILERARANPVAARELLGRALTAYQDAGVELLPGDFYLTLGNAAADAGDYSGAQQQYRQALNNYRVMSRSRGEGIALANLSWVSEKLGDIPASFQYLEESERLRERIGDRVGVLKSKVRRADLLYELGRLDEVLAIIEEVSADTYSQSEQEILATAKRFKATVSADRGDYAAAQQLFNEAMALDAEGGRVRAVCASQLGLARSLTGLGRYAEARAELDDLASQAAARSLAQIALEGEQLRGRLLLAEGNVDRAVLVLKAAADEARVQSNLPQLAVIAADLADVFYRAGDVQSLEAWVGVALDAQPRHGEVQLAAAKLALLKGDVDRAKQLMAKSQEMMGERMQAAVERLLGELNSA